MHVRENNNIVRALGMDRLENYICMWDTGKVDWPARPPFPQPGEPLQFTERVVS
jgi:hypothetical protein